MALKASGQNIQLTTKYLTGARKGIGPAVFYQGLIF
jgi:hypothetical protein